MFSGTLPTNGQPLNLVCPSSSSPYSNRPLAFLSHHASVVPHVTGQNDAPLGFEQRKAVISEQVTVTFLLNLILPGKSEHVSSSKATGAEVTGAGTGAEVTGAGTGAEVTGAEDCYNMD